MMEGFDWAMSYGDTLEEAKADFENFPKEYIEMSKEAGKEIPPELNNGELEFEYVYDLSGFFKQFPFISATALAKRLGINEGLMRRYKSGCAPVGEMQKKRYWMVFMPSEKNCFPFNSKSLLLLYEKVKAGTLCFRLLYFLKHLIPITFLNPQTSGLRKCFLSL